MRHFIAEMLCMGAKIDVFWYARWFASCDLKQCFEFSTAVEIIGEILVNRRDTRRRNIL